MKVLHVIHGYPDYYMAGSEIYTYHLTKELSKYIDITVFTRIENKFEKAYKFWDEKKNSITIRRINKPYRDYSLKDKYLDEKIDDAFVKYLRKTKPDIIHVGHLSHLSTNIIKIVKDDFNLPIIFTIHDFWLHCIRGQMITPELKICTYPNDEACLKCLKILLKDITLKDIREYRRHMAQIIEKIDLFLSPSKFMKNFFEKAGVPSSKIKYSRYGLQTETINYLKREYDEHSKITFGFIGRIVPTKGIRLLLEAYQQLNSNNSVLLIFGEVGSNRKYLSKYSNKDTFFKGSFDNSVINQVLEQIDVLIVPSIWYENSPLVIQEAFLAGIPVITSNLGGMSELVQNGVNGITFEVGNITDLKNAMAQIIDNPKILNNLKPSPSGVNSIKQDAKNLLSIYEDLLHQ
ncbi:MAG: glycosyltransferase family 4 protein [Candidatus Helarchaeota archaeon]